MNFEASATFSLERLPNGMVDASPAAKRRLWEAVEEDCPGLAEACGCYVFTIQAGKGFLPWYVGLAEKRDFRGECLEYHKVNLYSQATVGRKGTPRLVFLAKRTPTGRLAKPSKNGHSDIRFLENILIGIGVAKNPDILNAKGTKFLREMVVPGVINSPRAAPTTEVKVLQRILYR